MDPTTSWRHYRFNVASGGLLTAASIVLSHRQHHRLPFAAALPDIKAGDAIVSPASPLGSNASIASFTRAHTPVKPSAHGVTDRSCHVAHDSMCSCLPTTEEDHAHQASSVTCAWTELQAQEVAETATREIAAAKWGHAECEMLRDEERAALQSSEHQLRARLNESFASAAAISQQAHARLREQEEECEQAKHDMLTDAHTIAATQLAAALAEARADAADAARDMAMEAAAAARAEARDQAEAEMRAAAVVAAAEATAAAEPIVTEVSPLRHRP